MTSRAVDLEVTRALLEAAAGEMGHALMRTAFSPNIKERRDHSCALFDADGNLLAQAAHIPVHLGAMQASVRAALQKFPDPAPDDVIALNDPYRGGTHLPDLTVVTPVFVERERVGFAANRAHHADVGGMVPGSMPAASRELYQEGLVLPPVKLTSDVAEVLLANVRTPRERRGDLNAQLAANRLGATRLSELAKRKGAQEFARLTRDLLDASERLIDAALRALPEGEARAEDFLEGDGVADDDLPIRARLRLQDGRFHADFTGTALQSGGNVNAPLPVTEACALYVVRALAGADVMVNAGVARRVTVSASEGTLLNPRPPAAVAAGNVETSQRVVDVLLRCLAALAPDRAPAASQGTMNNVTIGGARDDGGAFTYYETLGGGQGAHPQREGMSGVHTHMTNTRNTPVEALEHAYPLRVRAYRLRRGTGGAGATRGGDGLVRETEVLVEEATASLLTDRRRRGPYGFAGGADGAPGANWVERDGRREALPAKTVVALERGDVLIVETPGGGGWGRRGTR